MNTDFSKKIKKLNRAGKLQSDLSSEEKRTYTVEEIQNILGISRPVAYKLAKSGQFHIVKIGKQIRISAKSFDAWLEGTHYA